MALGLLLGSSCITPSASDPDGSQPKKREADTTAFSLDEVQRRTFQYFWDFTDEQHAQILDRAPTRTFSSIAATGFGLTGYLVGVERGLVTRSDAAARTRHCLRSLWTLPQGPDSVGVSGYRGFFYHFLTLDRARRFKDVELSTIDTGLLMAGVLSVQQYFDRDNETEREIRQLADSLYQRVEWDWAMQPDGLMSMGWRPGRGFIEARWDGYNEAMVLLVLALGSPTHPIADGSWEKWCEPYQWDEFYGLPHLNFSPLFGHQYSQMYLDLRGIQDPYMREKGIDYFENSRRATLANRAYCQANPGQFVGYDSLTWGLTACDGPANRKVPHAGTEVQVHTYWARGASAIHIRDDGTLAPTAVGGSVPFAPEVCLPTLEHLWEAYHDELIGPYGYRDAFNLTFGREAGQARWFDGDYLGIDQGPILIQIENHRSELVWDLMKKSPYIVRGLRRAGFTGGWLAQQ
jgi:hypothetical protein